VAVVRYLANGELDRTFGAGGIVRFAFRTDLPATGSALALTRAADGSERILIAGRVGAPLSRQGGFGLARLDARGRFDRSFSGHGREVTTFGGSEGADSLVAQPGGRILALGTTDASLAAIRYRTDGHLDATFGAGGRDCPTPTREPATSAALSSSPEGDRVLASAATDVNDDAVYIFARYRAGGQNSRHFSCLRIEDAGSSPVILGLATGVRDLSLSIERQVHVPAPCVEGKADYRRLGTVPAHANSAGVVAETVSAIRIHKKRLTKGGYRVRLLGRDRQRHVNERSDPLLLCIS
jgi:uncharacterized delta-60 repeat protein